MAEAQWSSNGRLLRRFTGFFCIFATVGPTSITIAPMRNLYLLLSIFFLQLTASGAWAQTAEIKGRVVDAEGQALPYAQVTVFLGTDSLPVTGGLTDDNGRFSLELQLSKFSLQVELLSYATRRFEGLALTNDGADLGDLVLEAEGVDVDGVEIRDKANPMVLSLDKRIFNVARDLSNAGRNAAEILDNLPSVNVDVEGNVSLRGSQNVRILVDGKPSGLVSARNPDALRQLQGNMIEKIEVITNPSARYDAEGEVGILNIVLKKEQKKGLNGSFELTTGWPHNHRAGLGLNWRQKRFNLFTNASIGYRESPGRGSSFQEFTVSDPVNGDTAFSYERERAHVRGGRNQSIRFGSDFFLHKHHTLTLAGLYRGSRGNNAATLDYRDFDINGLLTNTALREDDEIETKRVFETELGYQRTFPQKGRKFTMDLKWTDSDDREASDILETSEIRDPLTQRVANIEDERMYLLQADYIHPFGKKGRFETGWRSTLRQIINDYGVEELDTNGLWFELPDFNNNFIYDENIHAAYVMAGNQTGRFAYQGGMRVEYSQIRTELIETNESNPRDYFNLFPSAHFSYELNEKQTFQLSYSRRISRPRFRHLLPFTSFSDNRNIHAGNPDLDPEFTHSTEVGYLRYFNLGSILSSIYYRHRTGVIQRVSVPKSDGTTTRLPVNLATQDAFGLEFNVNIKPLKNWKLSGNFNFYRAITSGSYEGFDLDADTYTWNGRLTSKSTLLKSWELQLTFDYRAPENSPQGRTLARYMLDFGIEKDILKRKGTLILSGRDLFNTRFYRWITETEGFYAESDFQWRARQITLTFSYRLNQEKKRNRGGRPQGGGDDF